MGEKGMESTGPVGPGSAATAVAGGGIGQTKAGGALGSLNDAIGTTSGDPAQMAGEQLGGGGGGGMSDMLKQAGSTGDDDQLAKKP